MPGDCGGVHAWSQQPAPAPRRCVCVFDDGSGGLQCHLGPDDGELAGLLCGHSQMTGSRGAVGGRRSQTTGSWQGFIADIHRQRGGGWGRGRGCCSDVHSRRGRGGARRLVWGPRAPPPWCLEVGPRGGRAPLWRPPWRVRLLLSSRSFRKFSKCSQSCQAFAFLRLLFTRLGLFSELSTGNLRPASPECR